MGRILFFSVPTIPRLTAAQEVSCLFLLAELCGGGRWPLAKVMSNYNEILIPAVHPVGTEMGK